MKLIACLSIYNEMQFIERIIAGLRENGIDRVIAVDGAYQGFPHEAWHSTDGSLEFLKAEAARGDGWLTLVEAPKHGWIGQEVKRTIYFRAADRIAELGDWLIQVDGDEELVEDGADYQGRRIRDFLATLPEAVTTIYVSIRSLREGRPIGAWDQWAKVYRWLPGLHYGHEHWDILDAEGRRIWDLSLNFQSPQARVWPHFRFHHWSEDRSHSRKNDKSAYEGYRAAFRHGHGSMNPHPQIEVACG